MGVKRAVDKALECSDNKKSRTYTLGPLIHNKQTIDMLKQRGVKTINEPQLPPRQSTILIRAHGVAPEVAQRYSKAGHEIIDGTCPKVKTVHKVIARHRAQGYSIVITGDQGHAEVIGLMGYAGEQGYLINKAEDVGTLPLMKKICLVSQTTYDRSLFDIIAQKIEQRFRDADVVIKKTICSATDQRQTETEQLASMVDALIVVGGKNSANTQRLAKIAQDCGTLAMAVESEDEIDFGAIAHCATVGVTAGASTPNWMIKRVSDYLRYMDQKQRKNIHNMSFHLFDIFANFNIFVSLGAIATYYVSCTLQGYPFTAYGAALCFFYFLSMYLWNGLASIESTQHLGISRYHFYNAHKWLLFVLSTASITAVLLISMALNVSVFYLMLFSTLLGSAYHLTIVPSPLRKLFPYRKLKDVPTSRDLFVALAWATVLTFLPQTMEQTIEIRAAAVGTFTWIFVLGFLRTLIFDLRDIEGDRIMGRETLITIIGENKARKVINLIIITCILLLLISPAVLGIEAYTHLSTVRFLFQIPVLLYVVLFVKFNPRIRSNRSALFNFLADGLFYLAAAGAYIATTTIT